MSLVAGLYLGRRTALQDVTAELQAGSVLSGSQKELDELRAELQIRSARHGVDRQSLEMVRSNMAAQNEQIAALEEDLRFYRSLMAPEDAAGDISLSPPVFEPGRGVGEYDFRFAILQRANKHVPVKGSLTITLSGLVAGEPVAHTLQALSLDKLEEPLPLSFRYFQALEGTMTLPEGFEPRSVEIVATLVKPKKVELREDYSWQQKE
ncbi:MAG: hypothetical protein ACI9NT_001085 [Bacteroidia bacterium]